MAKATVDDIDSASGDDAVYPIRTISNLTGVNAVTLRAWERRYGLIKPQRTAKGHRLYTAHDLERIRQVLALLDQGVAISQTRRLLDQPIAAAARSEADGADVWQDYQDRVLDALQSFDEVSLDNTYNDALSLYPVELVHERLVTPLLRLLGQRWKATPGGVAEEHFFSVYLRNKLGARISYLNQHSRGSLLLLACLPGEQHEFGMLMFALTAIAHGYRVILFGANLPLDQIPYVLQRRRCDAVVLSGSTRQTRAVLSEKLAELVQRTEVPVFVGGAVADRLQHELEAARAIAVGQAAAPALKIITDVLTSPAARGHRVG